MKTRSLLLALVLCVPVQIAFAGDFEEGVAAYDKGDYQTAHSSFLKAAEQGNAEAQFNLGVMYANGQGVAWDHKEAVKWYHMAAEQGHAKAQFNLGAMYGGDEQLPRDRKLPRDRRNELIKEAEMIGDGRYVEQDYKEAVKWYRKAAENGNAVAQRRLAAAYYEGRGVPQDHKEAARRYRIVAEQGNVEAQAEIGLMYEQGQGVPQDYVSAHIWFNISGANGYETGRKLRDLVAEKMTPAQLAEAQRLAREWMEKHGK